MSFNAFTFDEDDVALQRRVNDLLDWGMLLSVVGLLAMGLISIYSATFDAGTSVYFKKQLVYAGVGFVLALVCYFLPERWIRDFSYAMYGVGILMLIAVLIPGIGKVVNGQQCWIQIGGFTFQPSELAKVTTLLALARYISEKGVDVKTIRDLAVIGGMVLLPIALVMGQPDTGSATVFIAMSLGIFLWIGGDLFFLYCVASVPFIGISALYGVLFESMVVFGIVAALVTIGAFAFRRNIIVTIVAVAMLVGVGLSVEPVFKKLEPYKQARLVTLFEPERNPRGQGYHVIQSILAVGSGGLTGKGFLKGTQTQLRYIPEQWTDFIFCVPSEEFGFVGSVVVIALLIAMILRSMNIAALVRTKFASVVAIGFGSLMFYHTLVNIGMAIGLFPVMGIPLPFLSAGGTALIMNMCIVGMLLNFYKTRRRRTGGVA
ncbi:rod shape-determining protein RodA [soil metagenome]